MILTYAPEGAEPRKWPVEPAKMMTSEAEAIEKVTGMTWDEFGLALVKGSVVARRALLWVMLKRSEPTLRHNQIDPPVGSLTLEYERPELEAMREEVLKSTETDEDMRELALGMLQTELDALPDEEEVPKADLNGEDSPGSVTLHISSASGPTRASV